MKRAPKDPSRFRDAARNRKEEIRFRVAMDRFIEENAGSSYEKLENFPKYLSRQSLAHFLALYEVFKAVLRVQGDVIEGGREHRQERSS